MPIDTKRREITLALATLPSLALSFADAGGLGIDESGFFKIGGIDQWISIQGRDATNPVILYLHGGPAEAQSPFLKEFLPWQEHFTVVNWDQRGSGKTYGRNGASTPGMDTPESAVEQLTADAIEVATTVSKRLAKRKIILVGQSWGTILGLHVIKRRPDLFYAFVGTGEFVNWARGLQELERLARLEAAAANDQETLKSLHQVAALPPTDMRRIGASGKYRMVPTDLEYLKIQRDFIGPPPPPTTGDVADWIAGGGFSLPKLLPAVFSFDAMTFAPVLPVPFFVIQGRDDHVAPAVLAREYVSRVRAPRKAFTTIQGGHFACFTSPGEFVTALRKNLHPLVG
ncbi:MAG TPA: alpha/beta hydrolase [Steroidobacteraceae bacterium]